ncbi:septum site-determining protein Ssd [Actinomadura atramentaria]|uniref:septum site-determining protein Ssd n=1 Tax=Actinomadura atramentaria TaxID=1990 RepID=UPI00036D1472|nr:septum site-determining protein Ssd [Actinomadura atramentaria]
MTGTALIASGDAPLRDDLLRLAAAAGTTAETAADPARARAGWRRAGLVVVGADLADALAGVPHRGGVVVAARHGDPDVYRRAVAIGARDIAVLPDDEPWLVDAFRAAADPGRGDAGLTVAVCGARGGSGASVLAAALAWTAARDGTSALLVDADPCGGGLDLLLGVEERSGARWRDLAPRRGRLGPSSLRDALPRAGNLSVLSGEPDGPVPGEAAAAVLGAAARGFDLTVVDAPRHPDALGTAALQAAAVTFLLVPAEVRATMAAARIAPRLAELTADLRLVVGLPSPGGLTPDVVAECLALPAAGVLERDERFAAAVEDSDLPQALRRGSLSALCEYLLAELPLTDRPAPLAAA